MKLNFVHCGSVISLPKSFIVFVLITLAWCFLKDTTQAQNVGPRTKETQIKTKTLSAKDAAEFSYNANQLGLMIRIIDLSRLSYVYGTSMEKAIRARGMTPDEWSVSILGALGRTGRSSSGTNGIDIPGIQGGDEGLDALNRDNRLVTSWMNTVWRPGLKKQFGLLGKEPGAGPLPSCAPTQETIQTAVQAMQDAWFGDPSKEPPATRKPGQADPRISSGGIKAAIGAVIEFFGGGKDGSAEPSQASAGVRGRPVTEGGSTGSGAPDKSSIWWQLVNLGSSWGSVNAAMGQPIPVDPGVDPKSTGGKGRTMPKDPSPGGTGNPNVIHPNPEKSGTGSTGGTTPTAVETKGNIPTPDNFDPKSSGSTVPKPGKTGIKKTVRPGKGVPTGVVPTEGGVPPR
jgi:hypothetical protein